MKTLITSHSNADWDAFASMLAARHFYDNASLLFPGTQEAGLNREFYVLDKKKYGFIEASEINWNEYNKLVLVDTRQKSRIKHILPLIEKKGLRIEIWDHHPASSDDITSEKAEICRTGATVTSLCLKLRDRGFKLSKEEATLLGIGIYSDTGSFCYSSTKEEDFAAAAWLLGQGMDVSKINDMNSHELTGIHIQALNSLLESAKTYMIGDIAVALAETHTENYLGDFAYLAHKLIEMEKFKVLFAIGIMGDRIQVVARSLTNAVDVGKICAEMGGGGHPYAASACIRNKMITEVREIILRSISEQIQPAKTAKDYMSVPAIGLESIASIKEANELMLHFGLKAIPIFQPKTKICCGLLDAQTAARACAHGLGNEPLSEYMQRRVAVLPPTALLKDFAEIIVRSKQRLVPIVEHENVVGVVTRTDLINVFANEAGVEGIFQKKGSKPHNVGKLLRERLTRESRRILELAGDLGKNLKIPVYAVGGFARDLLLNHSNQDIDLVAEGNGIALARALAFELGGRVREHDKFMTSVVIYHDSHGNERHIDIATARLEYYEYPAAFPTVELSSIKMDLFRRDFSINALAIRLDGDYFGELADFFGGQRDIKDKLIRVLHTLSFIEDPTRCIRAVRFEQRYKFKIGPGTEKLIRNILPLKLLEKLSPDRLFKEFKHLCDEENGGDCIVRLDNLGILNALGKKLALNPQKTQLLINVKKCLSWYRLLFFEENISSWICYYLALCNNLNYSDSLENYKALGLPGAKKNEIMKQRELAREMLPKLILWQKNYNAGANKISHLYEILMPFSPEFLIYLMAYAEDDDLKKNISLFITRWRNEKADINGKDLKRLGIKPGPIYSVLLHEVLMEKLNGKAPSAKSQLSFAAKRIAYWNSHEIKN